MIRLRLLLRFCILGVVALSSCDKKTATVLYISVTAKPGLQTPTSLKIIFLHEKKTYEKELSEPGLGISIPTSFVIRADGRTGPATITITAFDKNDQLIASGENTVTIVAHQIVEINVELTPADIILTAKQRTDYLFTSGPAGRQIASDTQKNFVVVWKDSCTDGNCDIWFRMFNSNGQPKVIGLTQNTEETKVNSSKGTHDTPAVAMQDQGDFVIVWYHRDGSPLTESIKSRSFTVNGELNSNANQGNETKLNTDQEPVGAPKISLLTDKNYIVVWHQQKDDNQWKIVGRLLNAKGEITTSSLGTTDPIELASFPYRTNSPLPNPTAAGGNNGGFMLVWRQENDLMGQCFGKLAAQTAPMPTTISATSVRGFSIIAVQNGFAVTWSDEANCGADNQKSCIRMQRFDKKCNPLPSEKPFTLNTTFLGNQDHPTLSVRPTDSAFLAVWTSETDAAAPSADIRGRRLLSNGLPVGADFLITTDTSNIQQHPSIAPLLSYGFIVVFLDMIIDVQTDSNNSTLKGRIVFPQYDTENGEIGSICTTPDSCKGNLYCMTTLHGKRCVNKCSKTNQNCTNGGYCGQLSSGSPPPWVCRYNQP